ncbi:MAG: TIGR04141 family sporadically distributed protein, partial [Pseudomonadales bacterium]
ASMVELSRAIAGEDVAQELQQRIDDTASKWHIEYWIADTPRADGSFNIPFFSKITLRDEVRQLQAMRYDVKLKFIALAPENI